SRIDLAPSGQVGRDVSRRRLPLALIACLIAAWPAWPAGPAAAKQPVAIGTGGAVVSDSTIATQVGLRVLRDGGSAADAAVAVAATLGMTDPFVAGIGGGGYFVSSAAATARVCTADGRGQAPGGG